MPFGFGYYFEPTYILVLIGAQYDRFCAGQFDI